MIKSRLSLNFITAEQRIEKKIIMTKGQSNLARRCLMRYGFTKQHPSRLVTSIYFDSTERDALRDNIDGNSFRDKFRVRYYNQSIECAFLEVKSKRNMFGSKWKFPIEGESNELELIRASVNFLNKEFLVDLSAVSKVCYKRDYFYRQGIRSTIDTNVRGNIILGGYMVSSKFDGYEVCELKCETKYEEQLRLLYSKIEHFSTRVTKSSKYRNSMFF